MTSIRRKHGSLKTKQTLQFGKQVSCIIIPTSPIRVRWPRVKILNNTFSQNVCIIKFHFYNQSRYANITSSKSVGTNRTAHTHTRILQTAKQHSFYSIGKSYTAAQHSSIYSLLKPSIVPCKI